MSLVELYLLNLVFSTCSFAGIFQGAVSEALFYIPDYEACSWSAHRTMGIEDGRKKEEICTLITKDLQICRATDEYNYIKAKKVHFK